MPDIETFEKISDLFKQLGDPTRMRIFWILCHHEECVIHISARMDMSSPAVAHHLRLLKTSGLVTSRRQGRKPITAPVIPTRRRRFIRSIEYLMELT